MVLRFEHLLGETAASFVSLAAFTGLSRLAHLPGLPESNTQDYADKVGAMECATYHRLYEVAFASE